MKIVARDWRELLAGSEGFLTGRGRAGIEGREVVWGEMVSGVLRPWMMRGEEKDKWIRTDCRMVLFRTLWWVVFLVFHTLCPFSYYYTLCYVSCCTHVRSKSDLFVSSSLGVL